MSYTFITNDDFSSIPGLKVWLDARFGVTHENNFISRLKDMSGNEMDFVQANSTRRPQWDDEKYVLVSSGKWLFNGNYPEFIFMHNGSPFGCYSIVNYALINTGGTVTIFRSGDNNHNGQQFTISPANNGLAVANTRNGSTTIKQSILSQLNNSGHTNYVGPFPTTLACSYVFTGPNIINNQTYRVNNVSDISTNTRPIEDYATGVGNTGQLGLSASDNNLRIGVFILYNWTGYSPEQIIAFDNRIKILLEKTKLQFQ